MTWLPLADLPLVWRVYTLASVALAVVIITLNVLFILPALVRESWIWIHDALQPPDVDRAALDRARMNLTVSITEPRKGANS